MGSAGISLTLGGTQVDLDLVTWYMVAPCGCTSGASIAYSDYGPPPARVIATAEHAFAEFFDSASERKKYERLGFTVEPGLRAEITERMSSGGCPHDPQYGYTIPSREGMSWAIGGYHGRRTSVLHLVDTDAAKKGYTSSTAVCGQSQHHWTVDQFETTGKVECTRCIKGVSQ